MKKSEFPNLGETTNRWAVLQFVHQCCKVRLRDVVLHYYSGSAGLATYAIQDNGYTIKRELGRLLDFFVENSNKLYVDNKPHMTANIYGRNSWE